MKTASFTEQCEKGKFCLFILQEKCMADQTFRITKIVNNIFRVSFLQTGGWILFSSNIEVEIKACRTIHS